MWPFGRREERRSISIGDPALAEILGFGSFGNYSGVSVGEHSALGLSAVFRSVSLIAGTAAALPLRTLLTTTDGQRERVRSFLDNPAGPDRTTPFEWKELVFVHLLLNGNAFLQHIYNGAGAIVGLNPIHPNAVRIEVDDQVPGGKRFLVTLTDGTVREFDSTNLTHIPALCTDGVRGLSPIQVARNSLGTAIAGDRAAARMFQNGALISGIVTPEEDLTREEAEHLKASIQARMQGQENAGDIAFINRRLHFTPWSLSAEDAQFLQSRVFQIEEVGRWYGVPPHLLGQSEKSTSWGEGISEQNRGLARYTLTPWTTRVEQRLSRLLQSSRLVEFDYSALLQPSPEDEIDLLIKQVDAGILTLNEARRIRNLPPLPGGDTPRQGFAQSPGPSDGPDAPVGGPND